MNIIAHTCAKCVQTHKHAHIHTHAKPKNKSLSIDWRELNTIDEQAPVTLSLLDFFFPSDISSDPLTHHIHTYRHLDPPHPLCHQHSNIPYRQVTIETGSVSTSSTVIPHFLILFGSLHPSVHPSPLFSSASSPPPQPSDTHLYNILQPGHRWETYRECFYRLIWQKCL